MEASFDEHRPHPWHGLSPGPNPPEMITAYIEITPFDVVKYELDKQSGILKVDRPQRTSSSPPTLYGLIPRTYCGERVAALSPSTDRADSDPLDVIVISERPISRADITLEARVVGGLRMIDHGEADDKIVSVLHNDPIWDHVRDLDQLPTTLIDRLEHYFETYKLMPDEKADVLIEERYGREHAFDVVKAAMADYEALFGMSGPGSGADS
ncbi:MAG: inorganic pyrophosphatase [Acidimicrobiia bacterium]